MQLARIYGYIIYINAFFDIQLYAYTVYRVFQICG